MCAGLHVCSEVSYFSQRCTLQAVVALSRQGINNVETLEVTLSQRNTSVRLPSVY